MPNPENQGRTEKPTHKKKNETRRKGNIAKSPELSAWLSMLVITLTIKFVFSTGMTRMTGLFHEMSFAMSDPSTSSMLRIFSHGMTDVAIILAPMLITTLVIAIISQYAEVGFLVSSKALKPKWERLNPLAGFKRLFSAQSGWMAVKSMLKVVVLSFWAWKTMRSVAVAMTMAGPFSTDTIIKSTADIALTFCRNVAIAGLALGLIDYKMAKKRHTKGIMMTKQEVKEEAKMAEGSPVVKNAIRKKQMSMSFNRMMSNVSTADIIVTNPTHFAVALKYDAAKGAPRVVAKGADNVAARIREIAEEHKVPQLEDPPLARTLFRLCEINEEIPQVLYEAVAKLLAFVYSLKNARRLTGNQLVAPGSFLDREIFKKEHRRRRSA